MVYERYVLELHHYEVLESGECVNLEQPKFSAINVTGYESEASIVDTKHYALRKLFHEMAKFCEVEL